MRKPGSDPGFLVKNKMVNYSFHQRKYMILIIIGLLAVFLAYTMKPIVSSFLGAIILYTLLKPLYIFLTCKKKLHKTPGALIFVLLSLLVIIVPFFVLIMLLVNRITRFAENPEAVIHVLDKISSKVGGGIKVAEYQRTAIEKVSSFIINLFPSVINSMSGFVLGLVIMYFIFYYMLVNHDQFEKTFVRYLPFSDSDNSLFFKELQNITFSNILGQGLIAVVQGGFIALGFVIFKIPDPLFWGMICFFLSFLPVLGTALVYIPAGVYMLALGNSVSGIGIILWGALLVANLDNLLRMVLARRLGNIHPLVTITGLIVGIPYFGLLGLMFGPLLIAYFILLVKIYERNFLIKDSDL